MEGSSKTAAGAASGSGLPEGPLVDVLSRLPAKSVCRFKCVSKGWCELIADPAIRKKLRQAMQGLFVQTAEEAEGHDEATRVSFSLVDMTARSVPFPFSFLTEMTGSRAFFLDSCNGLVLFGHSAEPDHASASDYFVCNPTTQEWLGVPAYGSRDMLSHTYLAFDPAVSSHFHLVQFQMTEVDMKVVSLHVYSSETGTWSQNKLEGQIDGLHEQGPMQFVIPFEWLLEGQIDEQNEQGQLEGQIVQIVQLNEQGQLEGQIDEQNEQGQLEGQIGEQNEQGQLEGQIDEQNEHGQLEGQIVEQNEQGQLEGQIGEQNEQGQLEGQIDEQNEQGQLEGQIGEQNEQGQLEGQIDEQNEQGQLEGQIVEQNEQGQLEGQIGEQNEQGQLEGQIGEQNEQGQLEGQIDEQGQLEGQIDEQNEQGQLEGQIDEQNEQGQLEGQIDEQNEQGEGQIVEQNEQGQLEGQIVEQNEHGQLEGQIVEQNEQVSSWYNQFKLEVLDYHCAFVNGLLHLIVWGANKQHILVVDIQGKARRIITVPGMADWSQNDNVTHYLGQSQGYLHCVTIKSVDETHDKLSIWVLQDYDTEKWALKTTVNSLDVFGETEVKPEYYVVDIHQDSNVLFFFHQLTNKLIAYNMDRREASVLATFQEDKPRGDFARYVPYFLESPALTNKH